MTTSIEINDRAVLDALNELARRAGTAGVRPALMEIGEDLKESTQQRFNTSTGPHGERWAPNTRATYEALVAGTKGAVGKKGKLVGKGSAVVMGKKPLVQGGYLRDGIDYQLLPGGNGLEVGTNRVYGAMQQFGGTKARFPNLWGDIPARPYLGFSASDRESVLDVLRRHLNGS